LLSPAGAKATPGLETLKLIGFSRPLALLAAEHRGFFAREGLLFEYNQTPDSVTQIRGLLAGTWDLAHTAADNVMAYVEREGADLLIFMVADLGISQKLFVQPAISAYADLRGQVLGVDGLDTGYAYVLRRMLQRNGLDAADYRLESIGGTPQRLDALRAGRVAGVLLGPPIDDRALRDGFRLLEAAADHFPLYPGVTGATTRRWAEAHKDLLVRYIRAYLDAADRAADPGNRDQAIGLLASIHQVTPEVGQVRYLHERQGRSAARPTIDQVMAALQVVLDLRWEMDQRPEPKPSPTRYFDPTYWQQAASAVP
jgi:ABC-type nitrate/sulfonate/bicarbonate transport system substrate-binding protein